MKHGGYLFVTWVLTFCVSTAVPAAADAGNAGAIDPETWYAESYGPLWHDQSWDKMEEILSHYDAEIWDHSAEGKPQRIQTDTWIEGAMKEWRAEGWVSSEVPDIRINRINSSTASFTTRWLDHYSNREDEYSCAWYLADLIGGTWKFTQFASVDCEAHGF